MAEDWYGLPFLILFGTFAVVLGFIFAFYPEMVESGYRQQVNRTKFTKRFAERNAPTRWVVKMYRVAGFVVLVGGALAFVVGLVGTILVATGVVPPAR